MEWTDVLAGICALTSLRLFLSSSGSFQLGRRKSGTVYLLLGAVVLVLGVGLAWGALPVPEGN